MALTKVQTIGIETGISLTGVTTVTTLNASTDTLSVGGTVNFGGNVSIAGTLTYEDVTNIDSVGIITARAGIEIPDNQKITFGAGDDLQIYHNGTHSYIADEGSGELIISGSRIQLMNAARSEKAIDFVQDGAIDVYHNGSRKFQTTSDGITVTGRLTCDEIRTSDDDKIQLGDSQDFRIYHDGSTNIIDGHYHPIELRHQSEVHAKFNDDGAVELYHNNSKKFETTSTGVKIDNSSTTDMLLLDAGGTNFAKIGHNSASGTDILDIRSEGHTRFLTNGNNERLRIASDGQIFIGGSNENSDSFSDAGTFLNLKNDTYGGRIGFSNNTATAGVALMEQFAYWGNNKVAGLIAVAGTDTTNKDDGYMSFYTRVSGSAIAEAMRIDTSGRVIIKDTDTDNAASYADDLVVGTTTNDRGITIVSSSSHAGSINFSDGSSADDKSRGIIQYDHANNYMRFYTNSGERARLTAGSEFIVGKTTSGVSDNGGELRDGSSDYAVVATAAGHIPFIVNRNTNDGGLVRFRQANTDEGSISISGSTVSYNGGHLARWSQLAGGAERTEILRGSVLSNLDEMCEWGEEDNEQLNRMKVSDVEGDINVSGVFQDWDDDDDTYTNDFYCAMTGDFVIRIASGVTVQRGNLLMSAGDGTAKPQGDGYIQDKTIAKVTSTTVSTTYSDGSYCVPCVLMAC